MRRRLYRSQENKVIGGVAGGLAEYFDVDPIIPRILFVLVFFAGGSSIIIYILMMIIVPKQKVEYYFNEDMNMWQERNNPPSFDMENKPSKDHGKTIMGAILIGLGTFILLDNLLPDFDSGIMAAISLIAFGGFLIYRSYSKKNNVAEAGL